MVRWGSIIRGCKLRPWKYAFVTCASERKLSCLRTAFSWAAKIHCYGLWILSVGSGAAHVAQRSCCIDSRYTGKRRAVSPPVHRRPQCLPRNRFCAHNGRTPRLCEFAMVRERAGSYRRAAESHSSRHNGAGPSQRTTAGDGGCGTGREWSARSPGGRTGKRRRGWCRNLPQATGQWGRGKIPQEHNVPWNFNFDLVVEVEPCWWHLLNVLVTLASSGAHVAWPIQDAAVFTFQNCTHLFLQRVKVELESIAILGHCTQCMLIAPLKNTKYLLVESCGGQ